MLSLFKNRDTKEYKYKIKTEKAIQTVMGNLKYKRRYYIKKVQKSFWR